MLQRRHREYICRNSLHNDNEWSFSSLSWQYIKWIFYVVTCEFFVKKGIQLHVHFRLFGSEVSRDRQMNIFWAAFFTMTADDTTRDVNFCKLIRNEWHRLTNDFSSFIISFCFTGFYVRNPHIFWEYKKNKRHKIQTHKNMYLYLASIFIGCYRYVEFVVFAPEYVNDVTHIPLKHTSIFPLVWRRKNNTHTKKN